MIISILISKIIYYTAKYFLISSLLISGELFSTPIIIQMVMAVIFGAFIYVFELRREIKSRQ